MNFSLTLLNLDGIMMPVGDVKRRRCAVVAFAALLRFGQLKNHIPGCNAGLLAHFRLLGAFIDRAKINKQLRVH